MYKVYVKLGQPPGLRNSWRLNVPLAIPCLQITSCAGMPASCAFRRPLVYSSAQRLTYLVRPPDGQILWEESLWFWLPIRGEDHWGTRIDSRHPWRSPCGRLRRPNRLSCRFVEPSRFDSDSGRINEKSPARGLFSFMAGGPGLFAASRHTPAGPSSLTR